MTTISESQLDDITHAAADKIKSLGIQNVDECALNEALHVFLSHNCGCEIIEEDIPNEAEIADVNTYVVCVENSNYDEDWYIVETSKELGDMNDEELNLALSEKIVIGDEDRVFLSPKNRVTPTSTANLINLDSAE